MRHAHVIEAVTFMAHPTDTPGCNVPVACQTARSTVDVRQWRALPALTFYHPDVIGVIWPVTPSGFHTDVSRIS